jgi:2-dehydro-3-deoxyphosphogluconate aldolase / (4S)-4-hydroxy-2-oxoglutarate aldolase
MSVSVVMDRINRLKIIAILRGMPKDKVLPALEALRKGGVKILEFTFDHTQPGFVEDTCEKVSIAKKAFGSDLTIGCGTVLSMDEANAAVSAGAELLISPHTDTGLIKHCKALLTVCIPGAFTPTEIVTARHAGADYVKLFPAESLDIGYIKSVLAPLGHIPLLAVGGVKPESVPEYLRAGVTGFGVGGQLVESAALTSGDYDRITERALAFTRAIAAWEESA